MGWGSLLGGIAGSLLMPGIGSGIGAGLGAAADGKSAENVLMTAAMSGLGGALTAGIGAGAQVATEGMANAASSGVGALAQGTADVGTNAAASMASSMPMNGGAQLGLTGANVGTGMSTAGLGSAPMMAGGPMNMMGQVAGGPMPSAQAPGMFDGLGSKLMKNPMMLMMGANAIGSLGRGGGGAPQEAAPGPLSPVQQRQRYNAPGSNGYSGGFGGGQRSFAEGGLAQLHSPEHPMGRIMMLRQSYGSRQEALSDLMRGQGPAAELLSGPNDPTLMYAFGEGNGRYVQGEGDGMSDDVPASIEGQEPAALADGEYVVPADAVSHIGNGSSNAGAQKLDDMIAELRKSRTGRTAQAPQIDAEQYLLEV